MDMQIEKIRRIHGDAIANYVERNVCDWVRDMLSDDRMNPRGPLAGRRVCDTFMEGAYGQMIAEGAKAFTVRAAA